MGLYMVTAKAEIKIVFNDENQAISSSNLETIQKIARDYNNNAMELHIEWTEYNYTIRIIYRKIKPLLLSALS